jgi:ketosteroid isomerase-like protein
MPDPIAPDNEAVVQRFLDALSARDLDAMCAELAPQATVAFPAAPEGAPQEVHGADANRKFLATILPMWTSLALTRTVVRALRDDPEQVIAEYESEGTLLDGSPYRNSYLTRAVVRSGQIELWREFFDPAPLVRALAALHGSASGRGGS